MGAGLRSNPCKEPIGSLSARATRTVGHLVDATVRTRILLVFLFRALNSSRVNHGIRVKIAALAILALIGAIWAVGHFGEPRHQGRSLSALLIQWLDENPAAGLTLGGGKDWSPRFQPSAGISAIGSNAVPTLLGWITERPSGLDRAADWAASSIGLDREGIFLSWNTRKRERVEVKRSLGVVGFRLLGTNGILALPELVRLMNSAPTPEIRHSAFRALAGFGGSALPPLASALTNSVAVDRPVVVEAVRMAVASSEDSSLLLDPLVEMLSAGSLFQALQAQQILCEVRADSQAWQRAFRTILARATDAHQAELIGRIRFRNTQFEDPDFSREVFDLLSRDTNAVVRTLATNLGGSRRR